MSILPAGGFAPGYRWPGSAANRTEAQSLEPGFPIWTLPPVSRQTNARAATWWRARSCSRGGFPLSCDETAVPMRADAVQYTVCRDSTRMGTGVCGCVAVPRTVSRIGCEAAASGPARSTGAPARLRSVQWRSRPSHCRWKGCGAGATSRLGSASCHDNARPAANHGLAGYGTLFAILLYRLFGEYPLYRLALALAGIDVLENLVVASPRTSSRG